MSSPVLLAWHGLACRYVVISWYLKRKYSNPPLSPPTGVSLLWQDGPPVVHISHFLVSNVQSKFYRLLLLVFFFNQITKLKFSLFACCWCWCCVCHEIVRRPFFFHHTRRNVGKTDFSVISTSNKLQKYFSYRHRIFTSSAQVKKIRKFWFLKNSLRHQFGVDGAGTWDVLK